MDVSEYFKRNKETKIKKSELEKMRSTQGISPDNRRNNNNSWVSKISDTKNTTNGSNRTDSQSTRSNNPNGSNNQQQKRWTRNTKDNNRDNNNRDNNRDWGKNYNKNDRNRSDRNRSDRNTSDRNTSDRNTSDRNTSDRNTSDRNRSDRNRSDRNKSNRPDKRKTEKYRPPNAFNPKNYDLNKPITTDIVEKTDQKANQNKQSELPQPKTSGGWRRKQIDTSTPAGMIEHNVRIAQGYLNKMTEATFDNLSDKFVEVAITENADPPLPGQLKLLIDRIFEQALLQPTFCPMYASLCEKIHKEMKNFRMVLLNKCQEEFELGSLEPPENTDDKDGFVFKAKKRMLGNIKFIGELFKSGVIVVPVIYECFNQLIKNDPDEEQIEALCKLLLNVGKIIDSKGNNPRIDNHIEQLKTLQKTVTSRTRFMIDDLLDIRNNNWVSLK